MAGQEFGLREGFLESRLNIGILLLYKSPSAIFLKPFSPILFSRPDLLAQNPVIALLVLDVFASIPPMRLRVCSLDIP
jgi:hypothetical protein